MSGAIHAMAILALSMPNRMLTAFASNPFTTCPTSQFLPKPKQWRLNTDASGKKVTEVEVEKDGKIEKFTADLFVVSFGAINSSALLLRSHSEQHPNGLANSSDQVGRNYMCHNNSAIVALSTKQNPTHFQKTMGVNDYYFGADDSELPLGHIQMLGKVKRDMLKADSPFFTPNLALEFMANHAIGYWITSEDLPDPNNRVQSDEKANITLHYTDNNMEAHERLLKKLKHIFNCSVGHNSITSNQKPIYRKKTPLAVLPTKSELAVLELIHKHQFSTRTAKLMVVIIFT